MAPNIVGAQVMEAIRVAVTPGDADIVIAKAAVRSLLTGAAAPTQALIDEVLSSVGVTPGERNEHYDIRPELQPEAAVDPDAMQLKRARVTHATKLAIAELVAEGGYRAGRDARQRLHPGCGASRGTFGRRTRPGLDSKVGECLPSETS